MLTDVTLGRSILTNGLCEWTCVCWQRWSKHSGICGEKPRGGFYFKWNNKSLKCPLGSEGQVVQGAVGTEVHDQAVIVSVGVWLCHALPGPQGHLVHTHGRPVMCRRLYGSGDEALISSGAPHHTRAEVHRNSRPLSHLLLWICRDHADVRGCIYTFTLIIFVYIYFFCLGWRVQKPNLCLDICTS